MLPRALAGRRRRTSPLNVLTSMSLPSPKSLRFDGDVRAEAVDVLAAVDADHRDRRAEGLDVEPRPRRHLDVEVGFDDVVVAALDDAMVGVDLDGVAALRDLELDVVEPIARGAAHGVDDHLVAGRAGDLHAAGEGLQPERPVRGQRHACGRRFRSRAGRARGRRRGRAGRGPARQGTRAKRRARVVVTGRVMSTSLEIDESQPRGGLLASGYFFARPWPVPGRSLSAVAQLSRPNRTPGGPWRRCRRAGRPGRARSGAGVVRVVLEHQLGHSGGEGPVADLAGRRGRGLRGGTATGSTRRAGQRRHFCAARSMTCRPLSRCAVRNLNSPCSASSGIAASAWPSGADLQRAAAPRSMRCRRPQTGSSPAARSRLRCDRSPAATGCGCALQHLSPPPGLPRGGPRDAGTPATRAC